MKFDPGKAAGEQARELHRQAFPDAYKETETPVEPEVKADPVPETHVEQPSVNDDEYKHRFETLQGKYNAEVPRLHSQNRELAAQIADLQKQITERPIQTAEMPALREKDDDGVAQYKSPHVTDEMRATENYRYMFEEYGQTHAERQYEANVIAARNTVKPLQEKVESVRQQTGEEMFNQQLSQMCPAWQGLNAGVNVDPEFIQWLQGRAPGARFSLHEDLKDAYFNADAHRMVEIINLYLGTKQQPAPKQQIPEELIVPPKSGGGQQTALDNAKGDVLRMADMEQLYRDYNAGKYRGKEAEYVAKKNEFMKAKAEGRLI